MSFSIRIDADRQASSRSKGQPAPGAEPTRIAVCMDGSELCERVLPHAWALARACGLPVTLLTVLERERVADAPPDPFEWELRRHEARQYLTTVGERGRKEDLAIDVEVIEGEAAAEICAWDLHHDVSYTALTTHGSSGASPWCLAGTARKLVEGAPGSVLLVPSSASASGPVAKYRRIVVPLDGSPRAEATLSVATRVAQAHASELVLVHVVPLPELTEIGPPDAKDVELRDRLTRRNERVASTYLDRIRGRLAGSHLKIGTRVLPAADPRDRFVEFLADEEADLVVLSAHGRGERVHSPVGSFAAHLIHFSETPLLILRDRAGLPARNSWTTQEDVRLPSHAAP
ncbi:MAG: universal stress protein [Candidatus Rokuibacteriota bacterium]